MEARGTMGCALANSIQQLGSCGSLVRDEKHACRF
jgi:hypothetical protein